MGRKPFPFQEACWAHIAAGRSGLLHATTGAGKTYAVWLGVLAAQGAVQTVAAAAPNEADGMRLFSPSPARRGRAGEGEDAALTFAPAREGEAAASKRLASRAVEPSPAPRGGSKRLRALWITPMRALAADSQRALQDACDALLPQWEVGLRTGDIDAATRAAQNKSLPEALVTTPESLSLLLAREDAGQMLAGVRYVVCDEWHELMGNKRGTQVMLALARLATLNPALQVWGLSATLGNLDEALAALASGLQTDAVRVQGETPKQLQIDTLIPESIERFPWGGHLGARMVEPVVRELESASTTLVFTNTRSQAEIWYQLLLDARPDWAGLIALHHGSLDKDVREWVEAGLKAGQLKAVVCTSSLDLGVDFLPVERVLQIGSAKGVARLLQRAGRSGHAPGRPSRITLVPTNALELPEAAAAREAATARRIEPRRPIAAPLDVLVQHLATLALGSDAHGPGFEPDATFAEVRRAYPYRELSREAFDWAVGFLEGGGPLSAYPDYHRIVREPQADGRVRFIMPRKDLAQRHRMSIGTIVSDSAIKVAWASGGTLGTIEESFISRLKPGDAFTFAGRILELVRVRDMTATVKKATRKTGVVPQWGGGKMPLSSELADATLAVLDEWHRGSAPGPELAAVQPLLQLQSEWSALPRTGVLVAEQLESKEGYHLFCYPFAGRMVHIGLASLLAFRAARHNPGTFSISMNDYGFELMSLQPFDWPALFESGLLAEEQLLDDVLDSLNASELAQRRFREIARISGLIFQGFPGAARSTRTLQASSSLFYEVFRKHDAGNLLLAQSEREVLEQELELARLKAALARMREWRRVFTRPHRPTPFAFALMIERLREAVTTEKLGDRVARMVAELERAAEAAR
ncbi:MAG TPA: ligase-associated DNA damage response DEXH box helicase [Burkholderiaceae bacterium]|nr:ligase-associated DNA damage response DEXH box helicase [Burkholderiaceae bacterium]